MTARPTRPSRPLAWLVLLLLAVAAILGIGSMVFRQSFAGPPAPPRTFDGDFFAPTWACVGEWDLDKTTLEWICRDAAFNVYERAFSPQLAAKVELARNGSWPCTDYPGFEYSAVLGGCRLPALDLYRVRH